MLAVREVPTPSTQKDLNPIHPEIPATDMS